MPRRKFREGEVVTVSCAEGDTGHVYRGRLKFEHQIIKLDAMPPVPVKIMMNVANPDRAFDFAAIPNRGVGLARLEFIINRTIGIHPRALLEFATLQPALQATIRQHIGPGPIRWISSSIDWPKVSRPSPARLRPEMRRAWDSRHEAPCRHSEVDDLEDVVAPRKTPASVPISDHRGLGNRGEPDLQRSVASRRADLALARTLTDSASPRSAKNNEKAFGSRWPRWLNRIGCSVTSRARAAAVCSASAAARSESLPRSARRSITRLGFPRRS